MRGPLHRIEDDLRELERDDLGSIFADFFARLTRRLDAERRLDAIDAQRRSLSAQTHQ